MASHIVLTEVGARFSVEQVDTAGKTAAGVEYRAINPKGKVPALEVEGEILTEGPAILQFIADRAGDLTLAPAAGTMARARVNEMLNFLGTELHVAFGPLFDPSSSDAAKETARRNVADKLAWLEGCLSDGRVHTTGSDFTIADAYAFVVANWANMTGIALSRWPHVTAFMARVAQRPAVKQVMRFEGLAA